MGRQCGVQLCEALEAYNAVSAGHHIQCTVPDKPSRSTGSASDPVRDELGLQECAHSAVQSDWRAPVCVQLETPHELCGQPHHRPSDYGVELEHSNRATTNAAAAERAAVPAVGSDRYDEQREHLKYRSVAGGRTAPVRAGVPCTGAV